MAKQRTNPGDSAAEDSPPEGDRGWYGDAVRDENDRRANAFTQVLSLKPPIPELYFATVRAIGTPLHETVIEPLRLALDASGYALVQIKLSDFIPCNRSADEIKSLSRIDRYRLLTNAGEQFCEDKGRRDAIVIEAVRHLHVTGRKKARKAARKNKQRGVAYLFRSLMHPEEVDRLRKLYGRQLFVISAFSPEEVRLKHLRRFLANDDPMAEDVVGAEAMQLIQRETGRLGPGEADHPVPPAFRMNITRTWQHADLFLDITASRRLGEQITRLVQLIFSHPFRTIRPEEIGMGEAFSSANESANLARRVGAAILSPTGDIVSMGTNDTPQPGGGVYRGGVWPDHRDHTHRWQRDPSDMHRSSIFRDLIRRLLANPDWLKEFENHGADQTVRDFVKLVEGLDLVTGPIVSDVTERLIASEGVGHSQFFDVIEYGRSLHAEMDAITSAARKGASTSGATLYCTTLPCHECARLIIGAGIKRVIFVEPYDKSRALSLYRTEMTLHTMNSSQNSADSLVHLIPYVGISPRRFDDLFSWVPRKADDDGTRPKRMLDGKMTSWDPKESQIRETILGATAAESVSRFFDLFIHEERTIEELDIPAGAED